MSSFEGTRRIRKVKSVEEMEETIDDLTTQGFRLVDQGKRTATLEKRSMGNAGMHAIVALITIWWSCGVGNLAYALFAYFCVIDEMYIKVDTKGKGSKYEEDEEDDDESDD